MNKDLLHIYELFKSAATDIPEYFPEWVKKHEKMDRYKTLSDITKNIPVQNYREITAIDTELINELADKKVEEITGDISMSIDNYIRNIKRNLSWLSKDISNLLNTPKEVIDAFIKFVEGISDGIDVVSIDKDIISFKKPMSQSFVLNTYAKLSFVVDNKPIIINIQSGTKIISALKILKKCCEKYLLGLGFSYLSSFIETMQSPSYVVFTYIHEQMLKLDKAHKAELGIKPIANNAEIVFSKNPSDILSMSARSSWESCQNIMDESHKKHNFKTINSAESPYVGIIYLTNGDNYKGRGEEMIARSLVFLLRNKNNHKILAVSTPYAHFDNYLIHGLFIESLQKHSTLKVIKTKDVTGDYFFPSKSVNAGDLPYFDDPIQTEQTI